MLTPIEKIIFLMLAVISLYFAQHFFRMAFQVINRGEGQLHFEKLPSRIWRALEITITQRTVFRTRLGTSLMHGFVVWGFLFYVLVNTGDVIEGYFDVEFLGTSTIGNLYRLIADIISILILIGMVYFLIRRFWANAPTLTFNDNVMLHSKVPQGLKHDSLIVGAFIIVHVGSRFLTETFWVAQHGDDAWQPLATLVSGLWNGASTNTLEIGEHAMWWLATVSYTHLTLPTNREV